MPRRLALRLLISLLTFALGVMLYSLWPVQPRSAYENSRLLIIRRADTESDDLPADRD
jgi:hypothetical protein